jgi:hypothetical protein
MIRVFSFSAGLASTVVLTSVAVSAQGAPPAPAPTAPVAQQQAAPAAPVAQQQVAPAPPGYAPAPAQGYAPAPAQGYAQPGEPPPGYAWRAQPVEMRYVEGRPIPQGYHVETRARKGLVISGSIVFGVPYLLSMSVAASSHYQPDRWLYAPVVGPFINLATRADDCNPNGTSGTSSQFNCSDDSGVRFFLMMDGLMQVAGATMFVLGLALPTTLLVRDDAPYVGKKGNQLAVTVQPYATGRSGYGLGVVGIF